MADDAPFYAQDAGRNLARRFEMQAYDLRAHLKKFIQETGEEAISDGFGFLTESDELRTAYIEYSTDAADAMKRVHQYLDAVADALRKVNRDTEITDEDVSVLFGANRDGGKR
ncbi:hypothetical protein [Streptomyces flavidovirens]|uniref:hypothetical protein n=1 Tax=Streptomyces flavidovirens TaxID=67298 RepID=UPI00048E90B7|nr:hypothetical protein [Streptomyces flavidovirens]